MFDGIKHYNISVTQENKIGKNIKMLQQAKEPLQDRLSKLTDISCDSIMRLENSGIANPTIETLRKIAKAREVSVDDLIK